MKIATLTNSDGIESGLWKWVSTSVLTSPKKLKNPKWYQRAKTKISLTKPSKRLRQRINSKKKKEETAPK